MSSKQLKATKATELWKLFKTFQIDERRKLTLHTDKQNFMLEVCQPNQPCDTYEFKVHYEFYQSYQGDGQKSGAYIFRPDEKTLSGSIPYSTPVKSTIHQGNVVVQITVIRQPLIFIKSRHLH